MAEEMQYTLASVVFGLGGDSTMHYAVGKPDSNAGAPAAGSRTVKQIGFKPCGQPGFYILQIVFDDDADFNFMVSPATCVVKLSEGVAVKNGPTLLIPQSKVPPELQ